MKIPRVNVAFDIDGIVANFEDPFREWAWEKYGLLFIETGRFHWGVNPKITEKMFTEIIAEFICYGKPEIPVLDGALVVEYLWQKCPDPLFFLTARDISTAGDTHEWIAENFPKIDFMLSVVKSGTDKSRFLERYGAFIEDRRKTAIDLARMGKVVFMPIRDYNTLSGEYDRPVFTPDDWMQYNFRETARLKAGAIILLNKTSDLINGLFDFILFK